MKSHLILSYIRYDVHTKLVSFMAPQNRGTMADSSRYVTFLSCVCISRSSIILTFTINYRNELFSSLFGKRQPQETADINLFS